MTGKFSYLAFYDLDHTILEVNSANHLVEEARRTGLMSKGKYRQAVYLSILYKLGLGKPTRMISRMLAWLKGLEIEAVEQLCREVFHTKLVDAIRPEILRSMEEHQSRGAANILLSSATTPICEPVYKHLKMDDLICTRLATQKGILTGTTEGNLVYGLEKKVRLLSYCENNGYDPDTSYYYGDSHTDYFVMGSVGNPVAVSPDKRLTRIAREKNWLILVRDR